MKAVSLASGPLARWPSENEFIEIMEECSIEERVSRIFCKVVTLEMLHMWKFGYISAIGRGT